MKSYKIISAEKEVEHQYLGMLVDHISFGVASFNRSGKILLVNNAFLKIAGIPHLHTVEQLQRKNNPLFEEIRSLESGRKKLIKLTQDHQMMTLALYASSFKLEDEVFTIISIQNISNEISATEIEAWQRLIKVLTHEIMNSVSPIISLSNSLHELTDMHGTGAEQSTLLKGLDAIKTRSESLMLFTQRYRKLIQIPPLDFKTVYISDVVERLLLLIEPMLKQKGIHAQKNLSPVVARLDPVLIEQAILNILQNAIDAVENAEAPAIEVIVGQEQKQITISISDNGKGIGSHDLDKIFIPFYTTKKDGSGVGLALARQIVLMHGGQIFVKSELNRGSTFIIVL